MKGSLKLLKQLVKNRWVKVPIFRILLLTTSSDKVGLKIKLREEILAEPHALELLKSIKGDPSYVRLKFVRRFVILRPDSVV